MGIQCINQLNSEKDPIPLNIKIRILKLRGLYVTSQGTTLLALGFHFYLLFENTFHDFVRRAPFTHKFLILMKIFRIFRYKLTEKNEKYEKRIVVLTFF